MNKYTCQFCKEKYDCEFKEKEQNRFCSILCKDMQKGKEMGQKWIDAEKKTCDVVAAKMKKHRRELSHTWTFKSMLSDKLNKLKRNIDE